MKISWSKKRLILAFCVSAAAAFFIFRYVELLQTKAKIEAQLAQTRRQVGFLDAQLKEEKTKVETLSQEKSGLEQGLKEAEVKIARLNSEKLEAESHIFSLIGEIQSLEKANSGLSQDNEQLGLTLKEVQEKNSLMEAKLGSIQELKKEIRNLKRKKKAVSLVPKMELKALSAPKAEIKEGAGSLTGRKLFPDLDEEGNSGFIVKDGEPTYRKRLKIEVRPGL